MATMTLSNITATSVTITITGCTSGNTVAIYLRPADVQSQSPYTYSITSSTFTRTITGLDPETDYVVRADISYGGSATWVPSLSSSALSFTTLAATTPPPYIEFEEATTDSISFTLYNAIVGNTAMVYYRPTTASDSETQTYSLTCRASTITINLGGLEAGTAYYISVDRSYGGTGTGDDWTATETWSTIAIALPRPSNWAWETVVASEAKINLTASEWNNFCARILAFAKYVGSKDNGDYTYSLDTVYTGDYITATLVNKARSAISIIPGHGTLPSRVSSEDDIYASFFNGLKDALNAIE